MSGGEVDRSANAQRLIVLGEEHVEVLPNGEEAKAVTVQEGDNCLLTRLKDPWASLEIKKEFNREGVTQYIRGDEFEVSRFFKRC